MPWYLSHSGKPFPGFWVCCVMQYIDYCLCLCVCMFVSPSICLSYFIYFLVSMISQSHLWPSTEVMEGAASSHGRLWRAAQERAVWRPHWPHQGETLSAGWCSHLLSSRTGEKEKKLKKKKLSQDITFFYFISGHNHVVKGNDWYFLSIIASIDCS